MRLARDRVLEDFSYSWLEVCGKIEGQIEL